jgi:hypothetical protein
MPGHDDSGNGYIRDQNLIMAKLEEHSAALAKIAEQLSDHKTELAVISIKSSFWGAISGVTTAVITLGIAYLKSWRQP